MIKEIHAKSILRKHKKIESWFMTHYGLNLYRGCTHDCTYCDGRAEKYQVAGEFGKDIAVKTNAIELLQKELDPSRKRKPMPKSFMMLGGGVCDAYQPVEKKYKLARQTLELIYKYKYPVHVLTKSTLVEHDLDLLQKINKQNKAIVCFSFSSADDSISKIFEPGVASPTERFATMRKFTHAGITCGMFLMPVIPFVTDSLEMIEKSIKRAREAGVKFTIFGTMTMKVGRQKEHFVQVLQKYYSELVSKYDKIYPVNSQWGESSFEYNAKIHAVFEKIARKFKMPVRIPFDIYKGVIDENDLIIVVLEHLDYILKIKGQKSPYGYAAYSLSKLQEPINQVSKERLLKIRGIGPATFGIIKEIIETGRCRYYDNLIH